MGEQFDAQFDRMLLKTSHPRVDMRLKSPFTALVVGPTGSGKTHAVFKMIENKDSICTEPPVEVHYCYGAWQDAFEDMADRVIFHDGLIDLEKEMENDGKARWLIIDDLMEETTGKSELNNLYTKHSHHRNVSVFFLSQNLFKEKNRTQSVNTHYMMLFKNPRDRQSISRLAQQAFPGSVQAVKEAYADATKEPYSFLLIDMKQETPERCRLVGNFLSEDKPMIVYDVE